MFSSSRAVTAGLGPSPSNICAIMPRVADNSSRRDYPRNRDTTSATTESVGTATCSPVAKSFTPIVPASMSRSPATDAGLRAQAVVHELEGGRGVVVQPAHHPRVEDVRHAEGVQVREHGVEMLLGGIGQVVEQHRRVGGYRAHLRALVVEHPQRVDPGAPAGLLVEVEPKEELLQQFPLLQAAALVTQHGEVQPDPVES